MKLVIVEDRFSASNPTTASMVLALPHLLEAGCEVEVWADSIDEGLRESCEFRRLRVWDVPFAPPVLSSLVRHVQGGLWMLRRKLRGQGESVCYVSSGGRFVFAGVSIFHFYNRAWLRIQRNGMEWGPEWSLKGWRSLWGWGEDSAALHSPWTKRFLPVSDAIGDEMRGDFPKRANVIRSLPNAVDAKRYSPLLRREKGAELRDEFGYEDEEKVLLFVSQGHLARKGFWLALKAVAALRADGDERARMVLLGGRPKKVEKLERQLGGLYPDWREWLELEGWTDRVQDYMAAADALFFPSYFEAFSLVEIEAAAMGLPLILTRHHGSEMILDEGENGLTCGFQVDEIVATLKAFFAEGLEVAEPNIGRALSPEQWARQFVSEVERAMASGAAEVDGKIFAIPESDAKR
jgi:glycosyltransferase involved in cell wall biosynthesis